VLETARPRALISGLHNPQQIFANDALAWCQLMIQAANRRRIYLGHTIWIINRFIYLMLYRWRIAPKHWRSFAGETFSHSEHYSSYADGFRLSHFAP
jgi:hypothetical protein